MPVAQIQFVQPSGGGTGVAGQALIGSLTLPVTVNNADNSQVATSTFEVISVPTGSALALGVQQTGPAQSWAFVPDVRGGYEIHLTTTDQDGNLAEDYRVFQIAETTGRFIPPFGADDGSFNFGGQVLGWAPYVDAYLRSIDLTGLGTARQSVYSDANCKPQTVVRTTKTTDATANVVLYGGDSSDLVMAANSGLRMDVYIVAISGANIGIWHQKMSVARFGGAAIIEGTAPTNDAPDTSLSTAGASTWRANLDLSTNTPRAVGTGAAATNITWLVVTQLVYGTQSP